MNDVNYAALVIDEMAGEWYRPPTAYYTLKRASFEYYVYRNWAVNDLRDYVLKHQYQHPLDSVIRYRNKMNDAACETTSGTANFIFSIAVDVAADVYDILKDIWAGGD